MNNIVKIFDTTLRDGEQSPGATMTSTEKLKLACNLSLMGVDIIEAGFPAASPDDLEAVKSIALEVGNQKDSDHTPVICALARTIKGDIDTAWEGIKQAERPRIHTFIATSDIHMQYKLNMTHDDVLQTTYKMVSYAHSLCEDVEFSPEDAGRSDLDFLYQVLAEAIRAGASTINIPDTVGYTIPDEFGGLIRDVINNTPGIDHCIVSVHCHNDLGLATANTLAGIMAGARQAEVTINGIGERAGNTSLEEVVMALNTRYPLYGLKHNIDTTHIMRMSRMVSNFTGIVVQANKAIVGANAFAHEAGIHQDGLIKHQQTYEIMRPESVGLIQSQLVLGKHSGRHAFKNRMVELGYTLSDDEIEKLFTRFKTLADKKKTITNADLEALVSDEIYQHHEFFSLDSLQVACGTKDMPTATVRLLDRYGEVFIKAAVGTGPVDAVYKAIDAIIQTPNNLLEFNINAITEGIDALGEVTVRIEQADSAQNKISQTERELRQSYGGYGADTDIIVASAKAYLAAVNKMLVANEDFHASARINHQSSKAHSKTRVNDFPLIERSPEAFPNLEIYPKNWDLTDY